MKRIFICMLMCLVATLPLSFLAAADDPAPYTSIRLADTGPKPKIYDPERDMWQELGEEGWSRWIDTPVKQFVPGPVTIEYADTRWTEADTEGEVCINCGGDDILVESMETRWGTFEFVLCAQNPLINDRHEDRLVSQQIYCGDCNFLQRKQTVRETRLVCTNETYQLVRR